MATQRIEPHNLDVQRVINLLKKDECPASLGAFTYPDGSAGLLLLLAQPKHEAAIREFLQKLYDAEGYVSPHYQRETHCAKCGEPLGELGNCALCQPRYH